MLFLFPPTIVECTPEKDFYTEELFGPFVALVRFETMESFLQFYKKYYKGQIKPLNSIIFTNKKH